ncbi:plasmid replication protein RepB [Pseudomonas aeruginosa]|nr:plasmid replication protein RepB [Pseudomonas aeruginosa]AUA92962.1 plasmid replication protein RepB [Pseudomonas aeruginosa]KAB5443560.1 plasmid replication protein RepB [Pseudomonas aeruginosa]RQH75425.1 plasmid replication protein RepB [Pseudomonas aeruginosa]RUI80031.1 plasmid replication protein RepB [Pseudomonas aeruginosa]
MAVDLSAMRKLFEVGALREAIVAPAPMEKGSWLLLVSRSDGTKEHLTLARSTRPKIYKSLEHVRADAERVGFREVRLQVA